MSLSVRTCNTCGVEWPLTAQFYKPSKRCKSGFVAKCRECLRADGREALRLFREHPDEGPRCAVEGCGSRARTKGLCNKHYLRLQNTGSLEETVIIGDDERRFWSYVEKSEDGCWLWIGGTTRFGYGIFQLRKQTVAAHRYSYFLEHGELPEGAFVCHSCDVPPCVNPAHLFAGTAGDNNSDRDNKGRHVALVGEANGFAKLTEESVRELRRLHATGDFSYAELGRRYGVTYQAVCNAVQKRTWKHV